MEESPLLLRGRLETFAQENPLLGTSFVRESTAQYYVDLMAGQSERGLAAVTSMNETMSDLSEQLTIYSGALSKMARWQVELAVEDLLYAERMDAFFDDVGDIEGEIDTIEDDINDVTTMVLDAPEIIDQQMAVALARIEEERKAVVEALRLERIAVFEELDKERRAVMSDIQALSIQLLDESATRANSLIDHLFWRAALLLTLLVAAAVIVGIVTLRLTRGLRRAT
jgi:hypothetical protein